LALFHDRDPSRRLGQSLCDLSDHGHLVADLDHDRAEIEDDRATLGLDERRVVVEQPNQLALRPGRHLDPHRLHAWSLERGVRRAIGPRAGEACHRSAIAASTSTFSNRVSTDLAATCVRMVSFSIMFREIVVVPYGLLCQYVMSSLSTSRAA
jgi:hypothetical protein